MQADSDATPGAKACQVNNMVVNTQHKVLQQIMTVAMPVPVHQGHCPKNALHTA